MRPGPDAIRDLNRHARALILPHKPRSRELNRLPGDMSRLRRLMGEEFSRQEQVQELAEFDTRPRFKHAVRSTDARARIDVPGRKPLRLRPGACRHRDRGQSSPSLGVAKSRFRQARFLVGVAWTGQAPSRPRSGSGSVLFRIARVWFRPSPSRRRRTVRLCAPETSSCRIPGRSRNCRLWPCNTRTND